MKRHKPDLVDQISEDYKANTQVNDCYVCNLPIEDIEWHVNVDGVDENFHGDCKLKFLDSIPGQLPEGAIGQYYT